MTRIRFGAADIAQAQTIARVRVDRHSRRGSRHRIVPKDLHGAQVLGILGEWAVADDLGVDRVVDADGADDGSDLTVGAWRLSIRTCQHAARYLMAPANQPIHADAFVMCRQTHDRRLDTIDIVGAVTVNRFLDQATLRDWGHGDTWNLPADQLTPWTETVARMAERAPRLV